MEDPEQTNSSPDAPAGDSSADPVSASIGPQTHVDAVAAGAGAVSSYLEKALSVEFRAAMAESLQMPLEVRLLEIQECFSADFLSSVEERSCCVALVVRPAGAAPEAGDSPPAWLEVSPQIAFPIIDRLLGGSGREWYVPNRAMTAIERRLLLRVAQAAAGGLGRAFPAPAGGAQAPRWEWSAATAQMPGDSAPGPVVLAKFTLSMGRQAGAIRLCLPQELVGRLFPGAEKRGQAPFSEQRKRSQSPFSGQSPVLSSGGPLELSVVVQDIAVSSEELAGLAEGDVLMTDTAEGGEVLVRIGGIPRFYARLGVSNGRKAIQITRRIE